MSMYEWVFGAEGIAARTEALIPFLYHPYRPDRADELDLGRFRDIWYEDGEDGMPVIRVYTRNGGGNREDYAKAIESMRAHPYYIADEDDDFDSTYASFWFGFAPEHRADVIAADITNPRVDTSQRWKDALAVAEQGLHDGIIEPPAAIVEAMEKLTGPDSGEGGITIIQI